MKNNVKSSNSHSPLPRPLMGAGAAVAGHFKNGIAAPMTGRGCADGDIAGLLARAIGSSAFNSAGGWLMGENL